MPCKGLADDMKSRNRILHWSGHVIYWEPAPRHAELALKDLNLDGGCGKRTVTPGVKHESDSRRGKENELRDYDGELMAVGAFTQVVHVPFEIGKTYDIDLACKIWTTKLWFQV